MRSPELHTSTCRIIVDLRKTRVVARSEMSRLSRPTAWVHRLGQPIYGRDDSAIAFSVSYVHEWNHITGYLYLSQASMLGTLGAIQRALSITLIHLLGFTYYAFFRCVNRLRFKSPERTTANARLLGRVLRWMYRTLGATFVKLGQVLSTRPDLLSAESAAELRELQDDLPAFRFSKVQSTVEHTLGSALTTKFANFESTPIAAASVAQVHRAKLLDGTIVAVKVLRPHIRRVVERDGRIIRVLAKLMELVSPSTRLSQPVAHAEHILASIVDQTDLTIELRNYQRFRENFENRTDVVFPAVYPSLSGCDVLTMTFCTGQKVDEIDPARYPVVAPIIREVFLKMCFEDGFLHADMHPGNFVITDDNQLALYDVGLVCEISGRTLEHFVDFAKCITIGTAEDLVRHIKTYHDYLEHVDWDAVTSESEAIVKRLRSAPIAELEWSVFIADVLTLTRRHRIRPLPELVMVMVGVVTAEGIGKQIDPDTNTFDDIAKFILPILIQRKMLPVGGLPKMG